MARVRAAAYVRVSSDQQDFELQRGAIERAALARGDEIAEWHEEKEASGPRTGPVLASLLEKVSRGEVSKIYIFALDRLSRMGVAAVLRYFELFKRCGCLVVSVADGFDPSGPAGDVILAVFAWVAEQERKRLRERMSEKKAAVIKRGGAWGRPRKVDPMTLAAAKKLRKDGLSLRIVAARLKIPRATLARALAGKGHYGVK